MKNTDIDKLIINDFISQDLGVVSEKQLALFMRIKNALDIHKKEKDTNNHITFFKKRNTISKGEFKKSRLKSYQVVENANKLAEDFEKFKTGHELNQFTDLSNLNQEQITRIETISTTVENKINEINAEKEAKKQAYKQKKADTLIGYKIMPVIDGKLVSGADSRQEFELKKYSNIEMEGNGVYLSTNKQYVIDNYSGLADDEVLVTFEFDKNDLTTGKIEDIEPDLSVKTAKIMKINNIEMEGNGVYLSTNKQYVIDNYSGLADDEVLVTFEFDKNDLTTGKIEDIEPDLSVKTAKIMKINNIEDGKVTNERKPEKKLLAITGMLLADIDKIKKDGIQPEVTFNHNGYYSIARNKGNYVYKGKNQGLLHTAQNQHSLSTSVFLNENQLEEFGINSKELSSEIFILKSAPFYMDEAKSTPNKIAYIKKEEYDERREQGDKDVKRKQYTVDHTLYHYDLIPENKRTPELTQWYESQPEYKFYLQKKNEIALVGVDQYEKNLVKKMEETFYDRAYRSGVSVNVHEQSRAFYRPADDSINVPTRDGYHSLTTFAEVNFHELGHSTGNEKRIKAIADITNNEIKMNRDLTGSSKSTAYNKEEIVAQTVSYQYLLKFGLDPSYITRTATYQKSYLDMLNGNNKSVANLDRLCGEAEKAFNALEYLHNNDLTLNISHNLNRQNDLDAHTVHFGDKIDNIALSILQKHGLKEAGSEIINKTIGVLIAENNIKNPAELHSGLKLNIPTLEQIEEYKPTDLVIDNISNILTTDIIVEPSIPTSEVVDKIISSIEFSEDKTISNEAKKIMHKEISGVLNDKRGIESQFDFVSLKDTEIKHTIFTAINNMKNGNYDNIVDLTEEDKIVEEINNRKKLKI